VPVRNSETIVNVVNKTENLRMKGISKDHLGIQYVDDLSDNLVRKHGWANVLENARRTTPLTD
jgi:hypothetical protein